MRSIDIANAFISRHGQRIEITNLKLNKLVYFAHVESIRMGAGPLFPDAVEAWEYGPVEPAVYHAFKTYGKSRIMKPLPIFHQATVESDRLVDSVACTYGELAAFDLVTFSHRDGGAWQLVYSPGASNPITVADIMSSADMKGFSDMGETIGQKIDAVTSSIPNALRLLENS